MNSTTNTQQDDRRKKRAGVLKLGLAGLAVLGIGAAATSAAWSDDAWFTANAEAVTVQLQGSLNGTTWTDADTQGSAVAIPAHVFGELNQGANESVTLHLRNHGDVDLTLETPGVTTSGAIFAGAAGADVSVGTPGATLLEPGDTTTVVVTVTTDEEWPESFQGTTGTITLTFTGQS